MLAVERPSTPAQLRRGFLFSKAVLVYQITDVSAVLGKQDYRPMRFNPEYAIFETTRHLTNGRIKKRMDTMNRFFRENTLYFGYGIYLGQK